MKITSKILGLLVSILIISCHSNSDSANYEMVSDSNQPYEQVSDKENVEVKRKLIKEGSISFESNDIVSTKETIFKAVEKYKGYISSDQQYKSSNQISNTISIRVPANNFDNLLSEATKGIDKFDNKVIEIKDVTEEFLDIQARLKVKKELEIRYLELLKKANNVTEMLEVENQIGQLRSDIESIEGRLKYLENKVSFSTLTITFYQKISNQTEFGGKFSNGFKNGWENLILFFVFLTNIWPFIIILIALIFLIKFWRKKKIKKLNQD